MLISAIVAKSTNHVIGADNKLPWHLPGDLKWFKDKTRSRHVIMGRKSFESLPNALPGRVNIVVTRDEYYFHSRCITCTSIARALAFAKKEGESEAFILGGGMIYAESAHLWDRLYLTEVHTLIEGDTYFPVINYNEYELLFKEEHFKDEKNNFDYTFKIFERIK